MATHNATKSVHATAMISVVDTCTFDPANSVRVHNRGSGALYYRVDGVDPAVGADEALYMGPGDNRLIPCPSPSNPEVRIIAAVACAYSVEAE